MSKHPDGLITNPLDHDDTKDKLITNPLDKPGRSDNLIPNPLDTPADPEHANEPLGGGEARPAQR